MVDTSFRAFLSEGKTEGAILEEAIVAAWNGEDKTKYAAGGRRIAATLREKYKVEAPKAWKVGQKEGPCSHFWGQYFPGNKIPSATATPKTDVALGNQYKLSVKEAKGSQLMSAGGGEALATFWAAVKKTGMESDLEQVVQEIEKLIKELPGRHKYRENQEYYTPTKGKNKGKDWMVKKSHNDPTHTAADEYNKMAKVKLRNLFNNNPKLQYQFVFEAMTGEIKFDNNIATANRVLIASYDGSLVQLHDPFNEPQFVKFIAEQVKLDVAFKSNSVKKTVKGITGKTGERTSASTIRLSVGDHSSDDEDDESLDEGFDLSSVLNMINEVEELTLNNAYKTLINEDLNSYNMLSESEQTPAAKQAKAMGLEYFGFGRWGQDNHVMYIQYGGTKLVKLNKPQHKDETDVLHMVGKHVDTFKGKLQKGIDTALKTAKTWADNFLQKVISWISKSWDNLMAFLHLTPVVKVEDSGIRWAQ
jgi:hypothetical protein